MSLGPYWVDAIAAAVKTGDEKTAAEALGCEPRKCIRIDWSRRLESCARGGRKGGRFVRPKKNQ